MLRFHPLKAGRRRWGKELWYGGGCCFHPLKAGRRLSGTETVLFQLHCFHPLKAGRRPATLKALPPAPLGVSIPSRRVGDTRLRGDNRCGNFVSIPSRRVGDRRSDTSCSPTAPRFHPLKAGRRRRLMRCSLSRALCFHPLKAGRRLKILITFAINFISFHPLKAGRRRG